MAEMNDGSGALRWLLLGLAALLVVGGLLLDAAAPEPDEIAPAGENTVLQEVTAIRVEPVSAVNSRNRAP